MGIIRRELDVYGSTKENKLLTERVNIMFDSGATDSFVKREVAEKLGYISPPPRANTYLTAEKGKTIKVTGFIPLAMKVKGCDIAGGFYVVDNLTEDIIVGAHEMQKRNIKIDFEHDDLDTSHCELPRI